MPDNNPLFPSLDMEMQQVRMNNLQAEPTLPDYGINQSLQNIGSLYSQLSALKSINPLMKAQGGIKTSQDFMFPSIKEAVSPRSRPGDAIPTPFDPVKENLDRYADSKYSKNLGFLPGRDNEELYGRAQSGWGAFMAGVTGAWKLAKFQFADQFKGWGRLVDGIFSSDLSKVYDAGDLDHVNNEMQRIMNENPVFMTEKDRNHVFTWANLANNVQQTGFTLGAVSEIAAEELLMTALTVGTGGSSAELQGARSASLVSNLGKALKRIGNAEEVMMDGSRLRKVFDGITEYTPFTNTLQTFIKGARAEETTGQLALRGFGSFYRDLREANAAFTEARAETSGTYSQLKQDLTGQLYDSKQDITQEKLDSIDKVAREAGDANFWANAAIIGISNRIEFNNVFRGFKGSLRYLSDVGEVSEDAGGFFKRAAVPFTKGFVRTTKAEALPKFFSYFKNNLTEALQENLQNVSNNSIQAYYKANYNNPGSAEIKNSIYDAIQGEFSTEGAKTFLGGFLIGALTSPLTHGIPSLYNRVTTSKAQRQARESGIQNQMNVLNGFFSKPEGRNATVQFSISGAMGQAIQNRDIKGFQDLKDQSVRDFVRTGIETGKLDSLFARVEGIAKNLSKDEFEKAFGIEYTEDNKSTALDYLDKLQKRAENIKSVKEDLDYKFPNPFVISNAATPEDNARTANSRVFFEEAKWHLAYMKDAHLRTFERQTFLLRDMREDLKDMSYTSLFTLTDKRKAKDEVKLLRQEASLIEDVRTKNEKTKRADLLEALLPSLESGKLDPRTFSEYVNHIQKTEGKPPVEESVIQTNKDRLNDFLSLSKEQQALFTNINWLADPKNFGQFFQRHQQFEAQESLLGKLREEFDKKLEPLREAHPTYEIKIGDDANQTISVTPKQGEAGSEDETNKIKEELEKVITEQYGKEEPKTEEVDNLPIMDRLADIYDKLSETGQIDPQDKDFLNQDNVKKLGEKNAAYKKIMALLGEIPPLVPTVKTEEKTEEKPEDQSAPPDEDAYPYYEDSENQPPPNLPAGSAKTIIQEAVDGFHGGKRDANGDVLLEGGYSFVRGQIARMFKNFPHLMDAFDFVIVRDNRLFYEHIDRMSPEVQEKLDVMNKNSPYKYFIRDKKDSRAPIIVVRNRTSKDFIYFNPFTEGMVTDSKNGLIGAFTFDYNHSGFTRDQMVKFLETQPNQELKIDFSNIDPISDGAFFENGNKLRDVNQFFEGVNPDHGGVLHISQGLKDEEWNHPENTRNGGAFISIGNLNMIKLLPSKLSELVVDGKKYDIRPLFDHLYTKEEVEQTTTELQKIIYKGVFRPKNQLSEKIIVSYEPSEDQKGKYILKLIRQVDTTPNVQDSRAKIFRNSQQGTPTILDYLVKGDRRMNVMTDIHQDISIPILEGDKLTFKTMNYAQFITSNLFTNKARVVNPSGTLEIHPINNYLILPGMGDKVQAVKPKEEIPTQALTGEKPNTNVQKASLEETGEKGIKLTTKELLDKLRKEDQRPLEDENLDEIIPKLKDGIQRALIGNQELQFIKDRFGDHVLNHMAYAANSDYWGYWKNSVITLFGDAGKGVGYHEAWHHFSQLFLTRDEKVRLYNETQSETPELRGQDFKKIEEYLADKFSEYAQNQEIKAPPVRRNLFQKIWDFLKRIFQNKTPRVSDLDRYFTDLYQGKLESYRPTINNAIWGTLNYGFKIGKEEIFDAKEYSKAKGFFNVMLHRAFSSADPQYNLKSKNISMASLMGLRDNPQLKDKALKSVYSAVRNQIISYLDQNAAALDSNPASLSMLNRLVTNYNEFFNHSMTNLQIPSNVEDIVEQEEPETLDISNITNEDGETADLTPDIQEIEPGTEEAQYSDKILPFQDKGLLAMVSKVMRNFVLTIPRANVIYDNEGKIKQITEYSNEYGLPEPCDSHKILAVLGEELAGIFNDNEMLEKLNSDELLQRLPEVKFIREALPGFGPDGQNFSLQTIMSIMRDFNRVFVPVHSNVQLEGGKIVMVEKTKNTQNKIKRAWQDNFLRSGNTLIDPVTHTEYLNPDFVEKYWRLVRKDISEDTTISNRVEALSKLGVAVSGRTSKTRQFRDLMKGDKFFYFMNSMKDRLDHGQIIENPVRDMAQNFIYKQENENINILGESAFVDELLRLESLYSDTIPSNVFVTAKGTKKYSLMLPSFFNTVGDSLRKAQSRQEISSKKHLAYLVDPENYYVNNSLIMKSLFNAQGLKRTTFEFGDYNGIEFQVYDKRVNKQSFEMTGREKIIANINSLSEFGAIDLMRTGSSPSFYFYRMKDWFHSYEMKTGERLEIPSVRNVPFSSELYTKGKPNENFQKALKGYFFNLLVDEMSVMKFSKISGSKKYSDKIKGWGVFDDILSPSLKTRLENLDVAKQSELRNKIHPHLDEIMKDVEGYFFDSKNKNSLTNKFLKYAEQFGVISNSSGQPGELINDSIKNKYKCSWRDLAANFVLNDFVINVEYSRVFTGVPQFYKDYHKRASGPVSPGNNANSGSIIKQRLEQTHKNTMAAALGKAFRQDIDEFNTSTINDDFSKLDKEVEVGWKQAAKSLGRETEMKEVIQEYNQLDKKQKPVNDGQADCTLDFYRRIRMQVGNWNFDTDEIEYNKEVLKWKIKKGLYESEERKAAMQAYIDKYPKTLSTFAVMKLQYNGNRKGTGLMLPVYHKYAVAPIIPSAYEGTPLEDAHEWMLKNDVDYITAESGTKNYTSDPLQFWKNPDLRDSFNVNMEGSPDTLFSAYLKEQVKTSPDVKSETTWGTQIRSLWLSNEFNNGKASGSVEKLFNTYHENLNSLIEAEKDDLFREFGITEDGDNLRISNAKEFVESLQQQARLRDLNSNVKKAISYDEVTGSFETPLEIITNRQSVIDLIGGMIFRKLVRVKSNGDMLIQRSSTGTVKKGDSELLFYRPKMDKNGKLIGTLPSQSKIAFNQHFYPLLNLDHPDGKKIKTLARLNEAVKDQAWEEQNGREITIVAYRFPTEGINSMEFMHVSEFMPELAGSTIIVPREIVIKVGSDFDHDKLNIFRPAYGSDGKVIGEEAKESYSKALTRLLKIQKRNDALAGLIQAIFEEDVEDNPEENDIDIDTTPMSDEDRNTIKAYRQTKRDLKGYYSNEAVNSYIKSLSSPEKFMDLVKPNTTKSVKALALDMARRENLEGFGPDGVKAFVNSQIFDYTNNHIKFLQNVQGRSDLAVFAVLNKILQNLQVTGTKFNSEFIHTYPEFRGGFKLSAKTTLNTTPHLLTKEERDSFMEGGNLPIGYTTDIDGETISHIISELMNATVDIEKDAFYIGLGINKYNKGIAAILLIERVPLKRISAFLNQPVLKEYYRRQDIKPFYKNDINPDSPAVFATNVNAREILGLKNRQMLENYIATRQNEEHPEVFDYKSLLNNVGRPEWKSESQDIVFAHFLALQRLQKLYMKMQTLITTDTKKIASPIGSKNYDLNVQDLKNSLLISQDSIERLQNRSFTSPFQMKGILNKVFSTVMPTGFSDKFTTAVSDKIKSSDLFITQDQMLKLERTFANDYMLYIILEKGEYEGVRFREYVAKQLSKKINPNTLMKRLIEMQEKHPKLFSFYSLTSKLRSNASRKNPNTQNVELLRGSDSSTEMQEVMISEFEKLINFTGKEIPGEVYAPAEVQKVRAFFRDLAITSFGQSGFNRSLFYMTDILPLEEIQPIAMKALNQYKKETAKDPEYEKQFIDAFIKDFTQENPQFGLAGVGLGNQEPWRGKYLNKPVKIQKPEGPQKRFFSSNNIIKREDIQADLSTLFLFGDNLERKGLKGQAADFRGEPNAIGIATKRRPANDTKSFFSDKTLDENKKIITEDINKSIKEFDTGGYNRMVVPSLGTGLAQLDKKAPLTFAYLQEELKRLELHVNGGLVQPEPVRIVQKNLTEPKPIVQQKPAQAEIAPKASEKVITEEEKPPHVYEKGSIKFKNDEGKYLSWDDFFPDTLVTLENPDGSTSKYRVLEVYEGEEAEDYPTTILTVQSKSGIISDVEVEFNKEENTMMVYFNVQGEDEIDDILRDKDQGC